MWRLSGDIPVSTPLVHDGLIYITNAHGLSEHREAGPSRPAHDQQAENHQNQPNQLGFAIGGIQQ